MEVSSMQTSNPGMSYSNMDSGAMDVDDEMEIDLGLDLEEPEEVEAMNIEPGELEDTPAQQIPEAYSLSGSDLVADKVHVRGLDNLTTEDVRRFAFELYTPTKPRIVEWIDDTSANICYSSTSHATAALQAFTDATRAPLPSDPLQLRAATPFSTHPNLILEVRLALLTDVKKPRASESSRFYLLNPDKDPRERKRNYDRDRRGGGRRNDTSSRYRRTRDDDGQEDRGADAAPFDENMYDDDPASLAARIGKPLSEPGARRRRPRSLSHSEDGRVRRDRSGPAEDLFAGRTVGVPRDTESRHGRLRDRSASPPRDIDGDGRLGFADSRNGREDARRRIRRRSETPPRLRGSGNAGVELFGGRRPASRPASRDGEERELFPGKAGNGHNHHRRTDAFDAADASSPKAAQGSTPASNKGKDLFSRIGDGRGSGVGGGNLEKKSSGRSTEDGTHGFSIRGSAVQTETPGFSIRGLGVDHARVKELFPEKVGGGTEAGRAGGGGGKDLFERKTKSSGPGRRKAEDLFS